MYSIYAWWSNFLQPYLELVYAHSEEAYLEDA